MCIFQPRWIPGQVSGRLAEHIAGGCPLRLLTPEDLLCSWMGWEIPLSTKMRKALPLLFFSCSVISHSLPLHGLPHARLSFTIPQSLFKLMSIELMEPSNHLILCRHLLLLPSTFPIHKGFFSESALLIRWPNYWSSSFSISLSSEYSGLISFRIDWFDLLAVQGTLKSLF